MPQLPLRHVPQLDTVAKNVIPIRYRQNRAVEKKFHLANIGRQGKEQIARRLDPLSERPDLVAAVIARERADWGGMAAAAERAIDRSRDTWYAHLQLALAEDRRGRAEPAARALAEAVRLNPSEPVLADVRARLARGERVDLDEIARIFRERYELRAR